MGFENKPREVRTGPNDQEMIRSLKKGISQIEEELKKDNNTPDDILNLENAWTELKRKLASMDKVYSEESLSDYSHTLEKNAYQLEIDGLLFEKENIDNEIEVIIKDNSLDYFYENKSKINSLIEYVADIKNEIENETEAKDPSSREELETKISKLRNLEKELNDLIKEQETYANKDNVKNALDEIDKKDRKNISLSKEIEKIGDLLKLFNESNDDNKPKDEIDLTYNPN